MPTYCYACSCCEKKKEQFRHITQRNNPPECKACNIKMERDMQSERPMSFNMPYARECVDDTMGVHPSQVAEHRRRHPGIRLNEEGSVLIGSHAERLNVVKELQKAFTEE